MDVAVAAVMVPRVLVVTPQDKIGYVREIMLGRKIHALPVFDDEDRPVGIVTSTDLIDAPHADIEVADIMTANVVTVDEQQSVREAARIMRSRRLHHLLVTSGDEVVGIVSSFDLLQVVENG